MYHVVACSYWGHLVCTDFARGGAREINQEHPGLRFGYFVGAGRIYNHRGRINHRFLWLVSVFGFPETLNSKPCLGVRQLGGPEIRL